ncbi:hypothetical protein [Brucella suis]|uniref:hypothetical protein n=1 Tax=Brucella suis TaxID=29461 RepID=UPI00057048DA
MRVGRIGGPQFRAHPEKCETVFGKDARQNKGKPEAKKFQNWVTQVVLPAIRKDGMYVRGEEKVSAGEMDLEELTLITLTD